MIRLQILGDDTCLLSTLCARCPEGPAGCCVAPPEYDWSDIGRVVRHGGVDWLASRIAEKRVTPSARGLAVKRVRKREGPTLPRESKCVFHGKEGCTIAHDRRPATCNYFLCEHAFREGGPEAPRARAVHDGLKTAFERWDEALASRVSEAFPEGAPWDAAFLAWLGDEAEALRKAVGFDAALGDDPAHVQDHAQASGSHEG